MPENERQNEGASVSDGSDSEDEAGGADVLVRLGGALARANKNDEAATAFLKAVSILGRGSDKAFEARENFMVVVNRWVVLVAGVFGGEQAG